MGNKPNMSVYFFLNWVAAFFLIKSLKSENLENFFLINFNNIKNKNKS